MPVTLKNKVIVVTGATAGIGEAIVDALIKENAIVSLTINNLIDTN